MAQILQHLPSSSKRAMRRASRWLRACVDMHVDKLGIRLPDKLGIRLPDPADAEWVAADAEWVATRLAGSELRPTTLQLASPYGGESPSG